jgi:hypothetical protein
MGNLDEFMAGDEILVRVCGNENARHTNHNSKT